MTLWTAAIFKVTVVLDVVPYILPAAAYLYGQFRCVLWAEKWDFFLPEDGNNRFAESFFMFFAPHILI